MKTMIIYTSQTGFTKKYAEILANRIGAETVSLDKIKKKQDDFFADADTIIYGGWVMAGKVVGSDWFIEKIPKWQDKKLAIYCVGGSPKDAPETAEMLKRVLPQNLKESVKVFYCQGGIDYEKMSFFMRMTMKTFAKALNGKNATAEQKKAAEWMSKSYDSSDEKYIDPIVEYINE